jgi:predicted mannosyl-3-phosphoglycerate phosphatase (HAD superfamily)
MEILDSGESDITTTTTSTEERAPILAVDLDETIIQSDTEELVPGAKPALLALKKLGWKIIIWTARGDAEKFVPEIMGRYGLPFDAVNENLSGIKDKSRKIVFDAMVDNKNVDFTDGWEAVVHELEKRRVGWKHKGITKTLDPVSKTERVLELDKELEEEFAGCMESTFFWRE